MRIIGRVLVIFTILLLASHAGAQFYVSNPESATYDSLHNRYLVSAFGANRIISVNPDGTEEVFWINDGTQILGNCISGDTLFVSIDFNPSGVAALDLNTGELLFEIHLLGSRQLDGMATDTSGNLYIGDGNLDRIYKVDLSDLSYVAYAGGVAFDGIQDIEFDPVLNRLLTIGYSANSKLIEIALPSGTITTLLDPPIGLFDGIAFDNDGNMYLSSWQTSRIYRYGPDLTNPPDSILPELSVAANIEFNSPDDILIMPLFNANQLALRNIYADFTSNVQTGTAPLTVDFEAASISYETVDAWNWTFGDGGTASGQAVSYTYNQPGLYDVTIEADHGGELYQYTRPKSILVVGDTLKGGETMGMTDESLPFVVNCVNYAPLDSLTLTVSYDDYYDFSYDSFTTAGCRTEEFPVQSLKYHSEFAKILSFRFEGNLPEGDGPIVKIYFTASPVNPPGTVEISIENYGMYYNRFYTGRFYYEPELLPGEITRVACGDVNLDNLVNVLDILYMIDNKFKGGPAPAIPGLADVDGNGTFNVLDIIYMIDFKFKGGPSPEC